LDNTNIPYNHQLIQETTDSGDDCHYNIIGIDDREARIYFEQYWDNPANFRFCNNGTIEILTHDHLDKFMQRMQTVTE
jgi:hypothetical protein